MKKFGMLSLFMAASLTLTACCDEELAPTTNTQTNTNSNNSGMTGMNGMGGTTNSGTNTESGDSHDDSGSMDMGEESGHDDSGSGAHSHSSALNEDVTARWVWENQPTAGKKENLEIFVEDKNGKSVNDFDVEHTKLMHLIVVSKDLSYFDHIHPEYIGKGKFEIATALPSGGDYEFIADFVPKDAAKATLMNWMYVEGKEAAPVPLVADKELVKVIDGVEISLKFDKALKADQDINMTYTVKDAKTKTPLTNIEPYLGAPGHVVILDQAAAQYVHVHPTDEETKGPDLLFATKFPTVGKFKIWLQFLNNEKLVTVPFIVDVK